MKKTRKVSFMYVQRWSGVQAVRWSGRGTASATTWVKGIAHLVEKTTLNISMNNYFTQARCLH
jgi:hypothetical protein